jgi:hypothetical protein
VPVPRPPIRFVGIRHLQESFVPPGAFGFPGATGLFPAQDEAAPFSLYGDDLALESFVEETEPLLSGF